jgi:hypothetical protein
LVSTGLKDAFVVAFKDGKRITGRGLKSLTVAMPALPEKNAKDNTISIPKDQVGNVTYKVQIGAFQETVPVDVVNTLVSISSKGITQETDSNGLKIYYAGEFSSHKDALQFKNEVSAKGITDAFVVSFSNGKKVSTSQVAEADH